MANQTLLDPRWHAQWGGAAAPLEDGFENRVAARQLRLLVVMRNIAIVAQALTVFVVSRGASVSLLLAPMVAVIAAFALFNLTAWLRLASGRVVGVRELMLQVVVDLAVWSTLLALFANVSIAFVGTVVLPLVIGAACLSWSHARLIALAIAVCLASLVILYQPLIAPGGEAQAPPLRVSGVWINYAVSAGVLALFVVHVAATLRRGALRAGLASEREMGNEHVVRLGALAAGAAHELAQPLSTLTLQLSELRQRGVDPRVARDLVEGALAQVQLCQKTLASLLEYGRQGFDGEIEIEAADAFAGRCIEGFRVRRPQVRVELKVDGAGAVPPVRHDLGLRQAVLNLLDNAADASPSAVELHIDWDGSDVRLKVLDCGPGIAAAAAGLPGKLFFTTKPRGHGNGLGLYLANTAVIRLGGTLRLRNRAAGGACAEIALPRADAAGVARACIAPTAMPRG